MTNVIYEGGDWAKLPQEPSKEESILSPIPGSIVTVTTVGNTIPEDTHQNLSMREPGWQVKG